MAMSSLTPGVLFRNPGLNQNRTPTGITVSSEQVKQKYRRSSIPDKTWPPESPVAQVYDIRNTSSGLIILNNRMEKKSHLRVQSGRYKSSSPDTSGDEKYRAIEPERHFYGSLSKPGRHKACHDSSSPRFTSRPYTAGPPRRSSPHRYAEGGGGPAKPSEWHHYSSQIDRYRAYSAPATQRSKSARHRTKSIEPPPCFRRDKRWLQHPDMTHGQKKYMNSIACTYDITDMKQLKQAQYIQLIHREQQRGFFTPENYRKYLIYLNSDRVRGFNAQPPPKTPTKATGERKQTGKDKSEDHDAGQSKSSKEGKSITTDSTKAEKKQSAPRPHKERASQPYSADGNKERKTPTTNNRLVGSNVDSVQYMMYPGPDNPKQQKTTKSTVDDSKHESPRRANRPKSSKYRARPSNGNDESAPSEVPESDGERPEDNRSKEGERGTKYWQQPAPPVRETEPDGSELTMTPGTTLERDGERLEDVSSIRDEDNQSEPKPVSQVAAKKVEARQASSYDKDGDGVKKDRDGVKGRVYTSPAGSGSTS